MQNRSLLSTLDALVTHLPQCLLSGESEMMAFRESFDEEALETIAAFANTRGGTLLVGITDDGQIKGIDVDKETIDSWADRIAQATALDPRIVFLSSQGETIGVIQVGKSLGKPVSCRGRYFKRVGKSNRKMTVDDVTRAILDKVGLTWDELVQLRADVSSMPA